VDVVVVVVVVDSTVHLLTGLDDPPAFVDHTADTPRLPLSRFFDHDYDDDYDHEWWRVPRGWSG